MFGNFQAVKPSQHCPVHISDSVLVHQGMCPLVYLSKDDMVILSHFFL